MTSRAQGSECTPNSLESFLRSHEVALPDRQFAEVILGLALEAREIQPPTGRAPASLRESVPTSAVSALDSIWQRCTNWVRQDRKHLEQLLHYADDLEQKAEFSGSRQNISTSPALRQIFTTSVDAVLDDPTRWTGQLTVLDIACGTGKLLGDLHQTSDALSQATALGSDIDRGAVEMAHKRALLRTGPAPKFEVTDVLLHEPFARNKADVVVADLPTGISRPEVGQAASESWYPIPPGSADGETGPLFLSAMLEKLKPRAGQAGGGVALAIVASPVFFSPRTSYRAFRSDVVEQDILRAVVALPSWVGPHPNTPAALLVFDTGKPARWADKVQFVDLRSEFEDVSGRDGRRITLDGVRQLREALHRPRSSRLARTLDLDDLRRQLFRVQLVTGTDRTHFDVEVPAGTDPAGWTMSRYGRNSRLKVDPVRKPFVSWSPDIAFPPAVLANDHKSRDWTYRRLSQVIESLELVASQASSTSSAPGGASDSRTRVYLPADPRQDVLVATDPTNDLDGSYIAFQLADYLSPRFLAAWLNSDSGRLSRQSAVPPHKRVGRMKRPGQALGYLDSILIPIPPSTAQEQMEAASSALAAGRAALTQLESKLWSDPGEADQVRETMDRLVRQNESLEYWLSSLPYPIAAPLWTYITVRRQSADKAYVQLTYFFEAIVEFLASHLIGAIRSDQSLWCLHTDRLKNALSNSNEGLSFTTASFGTWRVTVEYLSSVFRRALRQGDEDQVARHLRLLGNPTLPMANRLLSTEWADILKQANTARNDWRGHGGTITDAEATRRHEHLVQLALRIPAVLGQGWAGLSLYRIGAGRNNNESNEYEVEVLKGAQPTFARERFKTHQRLTHGELYLAAPDGTALRLPRFIRLRPGPAEVQNTCHFYNRVEGGEARSITYHKSSEHESHDPDTDLLEMIGQLDRKLEASCE